MSEHKLQPGRTLIDGLVTLGRGLGYHVRPESPVRKTGQNPPAVDVAWMADEMQEFPLMIFEVETSAGNTIANNPIKVFGQPTDQFEKPLFFFHTVLDSGTETSRVDSLRSLFGLHNYRLYRLDHDEKTGLFLDILSQHRRLNRDIDLLVLRSLLNHGAWAGIDPQTVMGHAEKLQFRAGYLHAYATLALNEPPFINTFVQTLAQRESQPLRDEQALGYKTFIGHYAPRLIHLAVLSRAFPDKRPTVFQALRHWQEDVYPMPQIAPNFGLERDYDEFLLCMAPGLIASTAGIFGSHLEARAYLAGLILALLQEIGRAHPRISFYNAAWLLHMSAALPDPGPFSFARDFINTRGGIARPCLLTPPFAIPSNADYTPDDFPWGHQVIESPAPVPDLPMFREFLLATHPPTTATDDAILLGIRLLTEDGDLDSLALQALRLLSCPL
jgi:hypothetical protein